MTNNTTPALNIVLIGMPGSGKSTIGVQLAKIMGLRFTDTDLLIQQRHHQQLQQLLEQHGHLALRQMEEDELLKLQLNGDLIATGGSAVYSEQGMQHLKKQARIVYLEVALSTLKQRVNNESSRGIAKPAGQSFDDVYHERVPLYQSFADITIDNNKQQPIEAIQQLIAPPTLQ